MISAYSTLGTGVSLFSNYPTLNPKPETYKQSILSNPQHKMHLESAPTRQPEMFKIFQKSVGSAWQL